MSKPRMLLPEKKKRASEKELLEVHFDLRDDEERALYRFAKSFGDFSEQIKSLLRRQLKKRRHRRSGGRKTFSDRVLREMKHEVERKEEEEYR